MISFNKISSATHRIPKQRERFKMPNYSWLSAWTHIKWYRNSPNAFKVYRSENYSIIVIKVCLNFILIFNFYLSKRIPSTLLILSWLSLSPKHIPSCLPDLFDIFLHKFPIVAILINLDVCSSFILHWG